MAIWFQRVLLTKTNYLAIFLFAAPLIAPVTQVFAQEAQQTESAKSAHDNLNAEYFEIGGFVGMLNIEDFDAEIATGLNLTFNADENFFLQLNYFQAEADLSSFELSQGRFFSGSEREFRHYDFLVGYNFFHGELFSADSQAMLSTFNIVAGIGDTKFGGEGSFTYTYGIGYQVAVQRDIILKIDFRDYIYTTNIIGENNSVDNTLLSVGISYLF